MSDSKLHIDQVLLRLNEAQSWTEAGDYNDFLQKLEAFEKQNIVLDELLTDKLQSVEEFEESSFKRIILIVWYRRLRNALASVLLLFGAAYVYDQYTSVQTPLEEHSLNSEVTEAPTQSDSQISGQKENPGLESQQSQQNWNEPAETPEPYSAFNGSKEATEYKIDLEEDLKEDRIFQFAEEESIPSRSLQLSGIQNPFYTRSFDLSPDEKVYLANISKGGPKPLLFKPPLWRGLVLGFNIMGSFQSYETKVNSEEEKNTNRNYQALSNNGKQTVLRMNYGLTVEKKMLRNLYVSTGAELFTIVQKQKTDFILNEAPVYDIDGSIVGYISIAPERIQKENSSRISFLSFPVLMKYSLSINQNHQFQLRFGSALMCEVNKNTNKFDYQSLQQAPYSGNSQKISFNNIRYGFEYNRSLRSGFILGIGLERMEIPKLHQMSDATETRKTNAINLNVSIKYQLEK